MNVTRTDCSAHASKGRRWRTGNVRSTAAASLREDMQRGCRVDIKEK